MTEANTTASPAATETVAIPMRRKEFNRTLRNARERVPDWGTADLSLTDVTMASFGYGMVEVFSDTLAGPILAMHNAETDTVLVIVRKPGAAILKTAHDMGFKAA